MKQSALTFLALLIACCASWASDEQNRFLEVPTQNDTLTFDLDTVQFISPGKFTIITTTIDNPDVMKFELKTLGTLRQYCARPDGKYPAPTELLQLGPPDLPVQQIEVDSTANGSKGVSWEYPYRRLSAKYWSSLHCKLGSRTENELFMESYNRITNGQRSKEIYDCKRGLIGILVDENDDYTKAPLISPVRPGSNGENYYRAVCLAVMHQEPYLPK
jgi:hypothetical protein